MMMSDQGGSAETYILLRGKAMAQEQKGDVYRALGEKIDSLTTRAPWNEAFHSLLKELYTAEEADVVARMPYTLSTLERISMVTGMDKTRLSTLLERLCSKGLVMDIWNPRENQYYYLTCL
jgi:DNA-binding transcriptional regulator GbsR (MarR family)